MTPDAIPIGIATCFAAFGALCVLLVIAGLPGTWILIGAAITIDCLDWLWLPEDAPFTFHPLTILAAIVVGLVGEALEFALSAFGAKRFGATRRGMVGSVIGGVIGALAGTVLLPIPPLSTLFGAVLGTGAGAVVGELSGGERTLRDATRPAMGAMIGRVLGTLAKLPVALVVWVMLAVAAFLG